MPQMDLNSHCLEYHLLYRWALIWRITTTYYTKGYSQKYKIPCSQLTIVSKISNLLLHSWTIISWSSICQKERISSGHPVPSLLPINLIVNISTDEREILYRCQIFLRMSDTVIKFRKGQALSMPSSRVGELPDQWFPNLDHADVL